MEGRNGGEGADSGRDLNLCMHACTHRGDFFYIPFNVWGLQVCYAPDSGAVTSLLCTFYDRHAAAVARVHNTYITDTCAGWTRLQQAHGISRLQYARERLNREHDTLYYYIRTFVYDVSTYIYIYIYVCSRAHVSCISLWFMNNSLFKVYIYVRVHGRK